MKHIIEIIDPDLMEVKGDKELIIVSFKSKNNSNNTTIAFHNNIFYKLVALIYESLNEESEEKENDNK